MIYVIGRWGNGTSLVAEIVRRHGFFMGAIDTPGPGGTDPKRARNKWGNVEDTDMLRAIQCGSILHTKAGIRCLRKKAHERNMPPACKIPWILVREFCWPIIEQEGLTKVIWVRRPSKDNATYEMLHQNQATALANYPILQERWLEYPGIEVLYEDVIAHPQQAITQIANLLEVEVAPDAIKAIDPTWPSRRMR